MVQDGGEQVLGPDDAAGFALGDPDGHHLQNRSQTKAQYLIIGSRSPNDVCTYSDVDLKFHSNNGEGYFTRHDCSALQTKPSQKEGLK